MILKVKIMILVNLNFMIKKIWVYIRVCILCILLVFIVASMTISAAITKLIQIISIPLSFKTNKEIPQWFYKMVTYFSDHETYDHKWFKIY